MDKLLAKKLFLEGYNCAQAVAVAFADDCGLEADVMKKAAIAFGGGFAHTQQLCGALTGAAIAAGLLVAGTHANAKIEFYEKMQAVAKKFEETYGSMICKNLLDEKNFLQKRDLSFATQEEYAARPCLVLVSGAIDLCKDFALNNGVKLKNC